jgi:hypothetical protein
MIMTWESNELDAATSRSTSTPPAYGSYSVSLLGESLSLLKPRAARRWNIETEALPWDLSRLYYTNALPSVDFSIGDSDINDLMIRTTSVRPIDYSRELTNSFVIANGQSPVESSVRNAERSFSSVYTEEYLRQARALAAFKITLWESFPSTATWSQTTPAKLPNDNISPLVAVRFELQDWLEASIDDLALMLDLSPTTLVNLSKPGRTVRPKTVRKMVAMHGLLRELQNVLGSNAALTWSRTFGRRMLLDGRLLDFEQYISTHIFADDATRKTPLLQKWDASPSLNVTSIAPVGRPSRI